MIKLKDKQDIITRHMRGDSIRQISEDTNYHRATVTKYINRYLARKEALILTDQSKKDEIIDDIVKVPKYDSSNRTKRKVTQEVIDLISSFISSNKEKRKNGQKKQIMKIIDMHESLIRSGHDLCYSTIANLFRELNNTSKEAFIKQKYEPGDVCEFDWGEVKVYIAGKLTKLQMAVFTSAYSDYRYSVLFNKQDTQAFWEAHALFFDHISGSYQTMVYDNMRVAVNKFIGKTIKEPTEALLKLSLYYNFDFRFCNIAKGNEKGHVERSVEFIRRKAFCEIDRFASIKDANKHLQNICISLNSKPQGCLENKCAIEMLNSERSLLGPKLPLFDSAIIELLFVDKYSTIRLNNCYYSVPEQFVGKQITVKIYSSKIVLCYNDEKIGEHLRINGNKLWEVKIEHYTETLKRKPGALKNSLALEQIDERLKSIYNQYYLENPRDFIELIDYLKNSTISISQIEQIITNLLNTAQQEITTDKIKIIYENKDKDEAQSTTKNNQEIEIQCKQQLLAAQQLLTENILEEVEL